VCTSKKAKSSLSAILELRYKMTYIWQVAKRSIQPRERARATCKVDNVYDACRLESVYDVIKKYELKPAIGGTILCLIHAHSCGYGRPSYS
jgi:hypothetical protein